MKDNGDTFSEGMELKVDGGLGLEMVRHLVVGQLKGEIRFNHDDGTEVCIEFKRLNLHEN